MDFGLKNGVFIHVCLELLIVIAHGSFLSFQKNRKKNYFPIKTKNFIAVPDSCTERNKFLVPDQTLVLIVEFHDT